MGNSIVYFELIGPDSQVFSWYRPPGAPVAAHISEQPEYLFIPPGDDAPPAAGGIGGGPGYAGRSIFYVGVTDVNGGPCQAEGLGGEVVLSPQRNDGCGVTIAHFHNPAGNLVGVAGPA